MQLEILLIGSLNNQLNVDQEKINERKCFNLKTPVKIMMAGYDMLTNIFIERSNFRLNCIKYMVPAVTDITISFFQLYDMGNIFRLIK